MFYADVVVDDLPSQLAFAGDHVTFSLTGIDMSSVNVGKSQLGERKRRGLG